MMKMKNIVERETNMMKKKKMGLMMEIGIEKGRLKMKLLLLMMKIGYRKKGRAKMKFLKMNVGEGRER